MTRAQSPTKTDRRPKTVDRRQMMFQKRKWDWLRTVEQRLKIEHLKMGV
jgi:hypothetical protein